MNFIGISVMGVVSTGVLTFESLKRGRQLNDENVIVFGKFLSAIKMDYLKNKRSQLEFIYKCSDTTSFTYQLFKKYAQKINETKLVIYRKGHPNYTNNKYISKVTFSNILREIDNKISMVDLKSIQEGLDSLNNLLHEQPDNVEILWRIGMAHHNIAVGVTNVSEKKAHLAKGLEMCQLALDINPNLCEAHKWYALLAGYRTSFVSFKEKLNDGFSFKKHLEAAFALNPKDATLLHMLGRFAFDIATIPWCIRKISSAFFGETLCCTYDEALNYFLEAEKIRNDEWKENKLYIALCYIYMRKYDEAIDCLLTADKFENNNLNADTDKEIKMLLHKYKKYVK